ncbi:MAG TPA: hypothetical protein VFQ38_10395 [Longimicrobiales bacterium]|nr:hypothetical protein [Longimicrobiales bacterium]
MTLLRSIPRTAPLAVALLVAAASSASAQDRPLFEWRGRVDREAQIYVRGRDVETRYYGSNERDRDRARVRSPLPRQDGWVRVNVRDGRGDVRVLQQPSARNGYTAIIRITDRSGGHDNYRLSAYWEPSRGYGDRGDWRDGRGPGGWDRDGRGNGGWDRDGRGNGGWDRDGRGNGGWGRDGRGNGGSGVLHWSGRVDDDVQLRIAGNRVDYFNIHGNGTRDVRSSFSGQPLRLASDVQVRMRSGRGSVEVVQEPSPRNGYTALVRIRDPQGGFGYYDFDVLW